MFDLRSRQTDIIEPSWSDAQAGLDLAASAARLAITELDLATGFLKTSALVPEIFGIELDNYEDLRQVISPSQWQLIDNAIREASDGDGNYACEYQVTHPDGSVHWLSSRGQVRFNSLRQPSSVLAFTADVTPRKIAEQAALENQQRLQLALDAAGIEAFSWSLVDGSIEPAVEYQRKLARLHPNDRASFEHDLRHSLENGSDYQSEHRELRSGEPVFWVAERGRALHDPANSRFSLQGVSIDITERKQAETTRSWMAAIVESSDDAIIGYGAGGSIVSWNPGAERLYGYTAAEAIGKSFRLVVPPENADELRTVYTRLPQGQHVPPFETLRIRKDGRRVPVSIRMSPLRDETGKITGAASIARDISAAKRNELELRQNAQRLTSLIEYSPLAVVEFTRDFRIQRWSGRAEQIFGWSSEEVVGKRPGDFRWVYEKDWAAVKSICERLGQGVTPLEYSTNRNYTKDGAVIVCDWYTSVLRDDAGQPISLLSMVLDVTERERAVLASRQSEVRFHRLLESGIIGILVVNEERITEGNDVFLKMVGYSREDLANGTLNWHSITPPEYMDVSSRAIRDVLEKGVCPPFEKEYLRKDGSRLPVLLGAVLLSGYPNPEWISFVLDRTESKALEARLREKQRVESIGRLAGGIAHDFNNLLTGVLGNTSLALDIEPHPRTRPLLENVMASAEKAAGLAAKMLAYAGKGRLFIERIYLNAPVLASVDLVRGSLPEKVQLELALAPALPAVEADSAQIQQVITNLVLNAVESLGGEAGGTVNISTRVEDLTPESLAGLIPAEEFRKPGAYVCLEVRDTGCGMDRHVVDQIFDPFFSTKFMGRGLGLASVLGIVRGHGGHLGVHSVQEQGSTFRVYLPVLAISSTGLSSSGASSAGAPSGDTPAGGIPPGDLPSAKSSPPAPAPSDAILVVDDEEMIRDMARVALQSNGFPVLLAGSGADAVNLFRQRSGEIGLVVLDLTMPGMDGRATLAALRQIEPSVRVIVSSGLTEEESRQLSAELGVNAYLQKPYRLADLISLAQELISDGRASR